MPCTCVLIAAYLLNLHIATHSSSDELVTKLNNQVLRLKYIRDTAAGKVSEKGRLFVAKLVQITDDGTNIHIASEAFPADLSLFKNDLSLRNLQV